MTAANMYNKIPYNVVVPEFSPEREAPIFPHITKKYACQENVSGKMNQWGRLTWQIQQPDRQMVWSSVKLVMPMKIQMFDANSNAIDMNVTSRNPGCNIALSESPMNAFRQTTLSLNGKVFMNDNVFRRTLDTCYRGTGPQSYGDNHSLKPIVCRNIKTQLSTTSYLVRDGDGEPVDGTSQVRIDDDAHKPIDDAFSLLEHNAPYLERARLWQDNLSWDGKTWTGQISNFLELGPFQARARKSNTAVPYIEDFHLTLNYDENPSRFDSFLGCSSTLVPLIPGGAIGLPQPYRVVAAKLLEFGTIPTLKHHGESSYRVGAFPAYFEITYTEKPYLEVQYTKFINNMQPYYNLRCFEHQFEQSRPFTCDLPVGGSLVSQKVVERITSRVLAYPTKIYLWANESRAFKGSFIKGGVRRSCLLENIHLRINQRGDVIFNPSQEACYEMFQRHTNSSLEYGSWLKSPIYCFDPVDLGQSDMFANDARLTVMEWDAQVSLTPLQVQETNDELNSDYLVQHGYGVEPLPSQLNAGTALAPPNMYLDQISSWDCTRTRALRTDASTVDLRFEDECRTPSTDPQAVALRMNNETARFWKNMEFMPTNSTGKGGIEPAKTDEVFKIKEVAEISQQLMGFLWCKVETKVGDDQGKVMSPLFFVAHTEGFCSTYDNESQVAPFVNPYRFLVDTPGPVDDKGDPTHSYIIDPAHYGSLCWYSGKYVSAFSRGHFNPEPNAKQLGAQGCTPVRQGAYRTDAKGLRNDSTSIDHGPLTAGTGTYTGIDYRDSTLRWTCFNPTAAMQAGTDKTLTWRDTGGGVPADSVVETTAGAGVTSVVLRVRFNVERNSLWNNRVASDVDMQLADPAYPGQGFQMNWIDYGGLDIILRPEYTLKALYEYGNAQYQFTSDGMPTRVLPNLVPVSQSSVIPNLR